MTNLVSRTVAAGALAAVAFGGVAAAAPQASAAASGTTTGSVYLRTGTSSSSQRLTVIPKGTVVTVQCQAKGQLVKGVSTSEYWARVTYAGKTGYVSRAYVRVANATGIGPCKNAPSSPSTRPTTAAPARPGTSVVGGTITRAEVLSRARFWVNKRVHYSQDLRVRNWVADPAGKKYRPDCSGLVSMALHLSGSPNTIGLKPYVRQIPKESLRPGDLVGNIGRGEREAGHVVIFNGWADAAHTRFYTLEETTDGRRGAQALTRTWGSWWAKQAWRYNKIAD